MGTLVLTRWVGQSIYIGEGADRIKVTVNAARGNKIKLAFLAAKSVPIHREEIYQRIHPDEFAEAAPVVEPPVIDGAFSEA